MMIELSRNLEQTINAAIRSGRFASASEMVARLVEDDARRHPSPASQPLGAGTTSNLGSIGALRDSPDELDEVVAEAYRMRRQESWRDLDL